MTHVEGKSVGLRRNEDEEDDPDSKEMLKKKLQMKTEALMLISQELDQCRTQRDQFKLMAEQVQERFLHLKRQISDTKELNTRYDPDDAFRVLDLMSGACEENKCLRLQVEMLRHQLRLAQWDIKELRANRVTVEPQDAQCAPEVHQREEMIEQLEKLNIKCSQLQTDLQSVLDEKHELETERDAYKCKAHRLNHELSKALNASKPVDLDALINENRYLQERLQQLLEETKLARQSLSKYKGMLDSKRAKGTMELGANFTAGTVMTPKQVELLLHQGTQVPPQKSAAAISDLRSLCIALLEALNDRTLALAHQKKTNKILALRICELDSAVQSPTMKLLEGYTGANVDIRCDNDLVETEQANTCGIENIEETIVTNETVKSGPVSVESPVMQQLHSIQMSLPKNLGVLVQKALNNLKDNDKAKT